MNSETLSLVVALSSFLLLIIFIAIKMPKLKDTPETESIFLKKELKDKIKNKTKEVKSKSANFLESSLQKFLSKVRILSLKADKKLSDWIFKLRERSRNKKNDSYWSEIKESINKKK